MSRAGGGLRDCRTAPPALIVSDDGTASGTIAIPRWSKKRDSEWHYIAPGKSIQTCSAEILDARRRDGRSNERMFANLEVSGSLLGARRCGSIDYKPIPNRTTQRRRRWKVGGEGSQIYRQTVPGVPPRGCHPAHTRASIGPLALLIRGGKPTLRLCCLTLV